ncbi:hypothetical protein SEUBUCD646_0O03810 [Saccharomyces eubayanus]|uniref:Uncharacterized protein n=1 Tax=Saccharomyces eubayanus TaxID=1080349 RepID=A0ABN8VIQ3_SACEU|nr:hypothetical protein SEUBUCD650_0O03810 [Saccharomyces eubayanus]CAI1774021.1 hypothetical protein SEUBUCD646_0O03810 [Saccharomyces eubayanus]
MLKCMKAIMSRSSVGIEPSEQISHVTEIIAYIARTILKARFVFYRAQSCSAVLPFHSRSIKKVLIRARAFLPVYLVDGSILFRLYFSIIFFYFCTEVPKISSNFPMESSHGGTVLFGLSLSVDLYSPHGLFSSYFCPDPGKKLFRSKSITEK